ncbi:MAG: hypothetical protein IPL32_04605 [Chloracidobacterium sp.]|nr:hypothetical protein [Chloracidobacterium sp.]
MSKEKQALEIQDSIRQILFWDWDPIGIADEELPDDEYDSYIAPVFRILIGTRSENDLINFLHTTAHETIGLSGGDPEMLRGVAKKLLLLDVGLK